MAVVVEVPNGATGAAAATVAGPRAVVAVAGPRAVVASMVPDLQVKLSAGPGTRAVVAAAVGAISRATLEAAAEVAAIAAGIKDAAVLEVTAADTREAVALAATKMSTGQCCIPDCARPSSNG